MPMAVVKSWTNPVAGAGRFDKAHGMKGIATIFAGAALASGVAGAQPPQQAQAPAPSAPGVWQLDRGPDYCSLIRLPDATTPYHVSLQMTPAADYGTLVLIARGEVRLPEGVTAVVLQPSGRSFEVTARPERALIGGAFLWLGSLPDEFATLLAGSTAIELRAGSELRHSIPLSYTQSGTTALRLCTAAKARDWGVDEEALRALRRIPATTNLMGMTPSAYPTAAIARRAEGRVVVRVTVSPLGRASGCALVASSGSEALDQATCRVIRTRALFTPALDLDGRPVEASIIGRIVWRLPHRRR